MKDLLMHFAEWMNIGAYEPIREGNIDAYLEVAKFEAKPLVWVGNENTGWSAVTSVGTMRVHKICGKFNFYESHPDPKNFGECEFDTEKEAKERVQGLHNERILQWLG